MAKQKLTLAGLKEALQAEINKGESADIAVISKLLNKVFELIESEYTINTDVPNLEEYIAKTEVEADYTANEVVESDYTANADIDSVDELNAKIEELEEEIKVQNLKKLNPHEARLQSINGGKELETLVITELGDNDEILEAKKLKARFTNAKFSLPGMGEFKAIDVISDPEKYAHVITKLVALKTSILSIESEKKLTKKELESLNKNS